MTTLESKLDDLLNVWTNYLISQLVDPPPELVVALVKALQKAIEQREHAIDECSVGLHKHLEISADSDAELLAILEGE